MNDETLFALAGAIWKWVRTARGEEEDYGTSNCPLCHLYRVPFPFPADPNNCKGCPVVETDSSHVGCRDTPYAEWIEHQGTVHALTSHPFKVRCPECAEIAWREALSLCALIPEEATIPESLEKAIEGKLHIRYGKTIQGELSWWYPDEDQPDPGNYVVIRDGDCGEVRPTNMISRAEWDERVENHGLWRSVGLWSFIPADDPSAAAVRYCHQHPESAGAELYRLRNRKCAGCKHWGQHPVSYERAPCEKLKGLSDFRGEEHPNKFMLAPVVAWPECGHDGPTVEFETRPDFGCELWEAKP